MPRQIDTGLVKEGLAGRLGRGEQKRVTAARIELCAGCGLIQRDDGLAFLGRGGCCVWTGKVGSGVRCQQLAL